MYKRQPSSIVEQTAIAEILSDMDNFRFYQACKVTCWERDYFTVEAENYEEAVAIVRSWKCEDVTNIIDRCV